MVSKVGKLHSTPLVMKMSKDMDTVRLFPGKSIKIHIQFVYMPDICDIVDISREQYRSQKKKYNSPVFPVDSDAVEFKAFACSKCKCRYATTPRMGVGEDSKRRFSANLVINQNRSI